MGAWPIFPLTLWAHAHLLAALLHILARSAGPRATTTAARDEAGSPE